MLRRLAFASLVCLVAVAFADGPSDNVAEKVRPIPPKGIAVPAELRTELRAGCDELAKAIDGLRKSLAGNSDLLDLLPDVEVYHKAVDWALKYDEFYDAKEFAAARKLLDHGRERAQQLAAGEAKWTMQTGLVVRGYRSKIDGSVQPYGLVVPASWSPTVAAQVPARPLVARPWRNADRAEFHPAAQTSEGRVHAAGHDRAAPLRPVLQRQQVRRRGGHLRGDGRASRSTTRSTTTGSSPAASRWAGRRAGSSRRTSRRSGARPLPGPGSPRRPTS